jgi:transketolase
MIARTTSSVHGWARFTHALISMTHFGASGKGNVLFEAFGFSKENVSNKGKDLVEFYKNMGPAPPDVNDRPVSYNIINPSVLH